jgi:hypothetical protein
MEHWLFSVLLRSPPNTHLHGYLMGREKDIEMGCGRMKVICEKVCRTNDIQILSADDVLITMLDADGIKLVREVMSASRRCREDLATATDFYISAWMMSDEDSRAAPLLALHVDGA